MSDYCSEMLFRGGFRSSRCTKLGKLEHKGKGYCAMHYPPNVKANRKKKHEKWDAKWAANRERFKREAVISNLCAQFTTAELESAVGVELIIPPSEPPA